MTVLDKILREVDARLRLHHFSRTHDPKLKVTRETWEVESSAYA